jgi:hypothetical protein
MPEPLLNCRQLAEAVDRSATYISAAKESGYEMKYGTQTTLSHFLEWRAKTKFTMTAYVKAHSRPKADE